ncbi:MAG: HNH endonuclease, partial [Candidatus Odinarchaeota archaeon]
MAAGSRAAYNEYMAEYMLRRYHARRSEAIEKLGGECSRCGSTTHLEIDHIDPGQKSFALNKLWSVAKDKFEQELEKCQLLCKDCHEKKSALDAGKKVARGTHGTLSSYRHCKCHECRAAKSAYMKRYMKTYERK